MRELVSSLVRRSLPGLVEATPIDDGVRGWIERGSFYVDSSSLPDHLQLQNVSLADFLPYQTFDYERFALSSWETISDYKANANRPKALSWPLLKIYYSGFFGGHALMRALGQAIVRVEPRQAKRLTEIGQLFCGDSFSVSPGNYELRTEQAADRSFVVTLKKAAEGGGAHEVFWKRFNAFLGELATDVAADKEPNANLVIAKIEELQSLLSSKGLNNGSWLSSMRNEINYQHQYGVWFPFDVNERDADHVAQIKFRDSSAIRLDYNARKQPIQAFCSGSAFLSALSFEVSEQLAVRSNNNRAAFIRKWQRLGAELTA